MVERLSVDGLYVEVAGGGPVLALAHGFAGSARNFRPQVRTLSKTHRVVTYDARGHARSEAPADPAAYSLAALARDLASVARSQGPEPAVVGGLSMGAATALQYALESPERVRGLLLAAYPGGRARLHGGASTVAFAEAIERDGLEAAGDRFVWGPRSGLGPAAAKLVRQGFLEHAPAALAQTLRGALSTLPAVDALAPTLATLEIPTVIVVGSEDAPSIESSLELAAALPCAELVEIHGAGHVVNLEAAAAFDAAVGRWLAKLPPP